MLPPINPQDVVETRRARLLVVDDQPVNIRLVHEILTGEHDVFVATSGALAISFCQKSPPDLVLLDVRMPGMDGLAVCRHLKANSETAGIPVMFVTGSGGADEENACWLAGGADFVTKPVNPLTLRHRVRAHLQLKFYVDALHAMAFADGLTGVANRRLLDERLAGEWRRCGRNEMPLALLMIDVDFFKRYNDSYGHQAGDSCLRRVAGALHANLSRPHDLLGRYGGEEFACILPDTDGRGASAIAQRLEAAVRALDIEHRASDVGPQVTVSIGIAALIPDRNGNEQALVRLADQALYAAKQGGRGRAVQAGGAEAGEVDPGHP